MSTLSELNGEDEKKQKRQPYEMRELAKRVKAFVDEAEKSTLRQKRVKVWDRIDKMLVDGHLFNLPEDKDGMLEIDGAWYPKLHIMQIVLEMALPKVVDKHYRPSVVVEERQRTMLPAEDPRRLAMEQFVDQSGLQPAPGVDPMTGAPVQPEPIPMYDQAAAMLSAAIEYYRESTKMDKNTRNLALFTLAYGEYYRKDGYTEGPQDALVSMRDIFDDPYARSADERRYIVQEFSDTIGNIRKDYPEWGHLVRPEDQRSVDRGRKADKYRESRNVTDEKDIENSRVALHCAYIKDEHSTKPVYKTVRVSTTEERQLLLENGFTAKQVYGEDPETGQTVPMGWDMRKETGDEERLYPSGWRQVIVCGDVVLDDGTKNVLPEGCSLPIHQAGCFPIENTLRFKGLGELILDEAHMLNVFYKHALEDVQAGAIDVIDESVIDPNSIVYEKKKRGSRRQTLRFKSRRSDPSKGIDSVFRTYPAGETSQSILALLEACRLFVEWASGQFDPRMGQTGNRDQSGELIKELKDGSYERLGPVKESVAETIEDACRNWVHYLVTYGKDVRRYKTRSLFGEDLVEFAPIVIGQFEWNFDVKVGDGGTMPDDPEEAADYLEAFVGRIIMQPKPIRDMLIKLRRFPFERELIQSLDKAESMQQQQAAQQAQQAAQANQAPPGPDPVQLKMQEEAAKELAQALGDLAAEDEQPGAIRAAAITALGQMVGGQMPTDPTLIQLLQSQPSLTTPTTAPVN